MIGKRTGRICRSSLRGFRVGIGLRWFGKKGADQVIWTDLGVNFKYKFGVRHTPAHAIRYLKSLADRSHAREYVEKAPAQIVTPVRTEIARVLRWDGTS